jgi:hypothetical protein
VSNANPISESVASTSGKGSTAKKPKRPGQRLAHPAANSLSERAISRAFAASPKHSPGEDTDSKAVSMP